MTREIFSPHVAVSRPVACVPSAPLTRRPPEVRAREQNQDCSRVRPRFLIGEDDARPEAVAR